MKKILYSLFAVASFAMVSCSESIEENKIASEGDVIRLVASVNTQVETRTVYGDKIKGAFPIYWVNEDKVDVYCPEANQNNGGLKKAVYTVTTDETNSSYTLEGENSLCWGPDNLHHFFTFYPAGNVKEASWTGGNEGNLSVSATVPSTQVVKKNANGVYADMNSALMAGYQTAERTNSSSIVLPFAPITTALDITINPSRDAGTVYEISGLSISNVATEEESAGMQDLTGDFTYNFADGSCAYGTKVSRQLQIVFEQPIKNFKMGDAPIKVTAFLLPNVNTNLRVTVNANASTGGTSADVVVSKSCAKAQTVTAKCKNGILLPALPTVTDASKIDGSNWVTNVLGKKYVRDLSIPGSYDSMNYSKDVNGCDKTQTKGIQGCSDKTPDQEIINGQLSNGVRAFDLRLQYTTERGYFYVNRNNFRSSDLGPDLERDVIFEDFIDFAVDWLQENPTEFLVMFVRPFTAARHYPALTGNIRGVGAANFNKYFPAVMAGIVDRYHPYILDSFDPDIKVEDARGKILFIFDGDYTGKVYGNKLTEALPLNTVSGSTYTKTMTFANGTGSLIFHNYDMQTKTRDAAPYHSNALKAAANNHDDWNVTCLADYAVGGTSEATLAEGYDDHAAVYNVNALNYINNDLQIGQKTGIVLGCYMATTGSAKGLDLINAIWNHNFKHEGAGPIIQQ